MVISSRFISFFLNLYKISSPFILYSLHYKKKAGKLFISPNDFSIVFHNKKIIHPMLILYLSLSPHFDSEFMLNKADRVI